MKRECLQCHIPISEDEVAYPLPFCDFHRDEREVVLANLSVEVETAFQAIVNVGATANLYPAYVAGTADDALNRIEQAARITRKVVAREAEVLASLRIVPKTNSNTATEE